MDISAQGTDWRVDIYTHTSIYLSIYHIICHIQSQTHPRSILLLRTIVRKMCCNRHGIPTYTLRRVHVQGRVDGGSVLHRDPIL